MKKRKPYDLPGHYDERVFVGGNYSPPSIWALRKIYKIVKGLGLKPVFPYDDFEIPQDEIHDWDLRILHNCKQAIFEVTLPGGELMEIARVRDYRYRSLLVYNLRDRPEPGKDEPPNVRTMLLQSGPHEYRGYVDDRDLKRIIREFLFEKDPGLFRLSLETFGFKFGSLIESHRLINDGSSEHKTEWRDLQAMGRTPVSQVAHWFQGEGSMEDFQGPSGERVNWHLDRSTSNHSRKQGVVVINPALKPKEPPISYSFAYKAKNMFCFSSANLRDRPIEAIKNDVFLREGFEYIYKEITYPVERFIFHVSFPKGYKVTPAVASYSGTERVSDAIKVPPDKIDFDKGRIDVYRPKIFHRYVLYWKIPP